MTLYELLPELDTNRDNRLFTVADGPCLGEKLLVSDGKPVWQSEGEGFFSEHPEAAAVREGGIVLVDGTPVFAEQLGSTKKLVICGAGHVGIATARFGQMIGCETVIVDDRLSFVQQARAAGIEAVCEEFEKALRKIDSDRNTWFVIMTRGHKWDEVCLREIAAKPHAYIGMMGSRRRVKIVLEHLAETGVDEQILSRVHTPIGLSIGAETPEEIAISVIAEIIQVNSRMGKDNGFPADILEAVNGGKQTGIGRTAKILMTIIRRTSSAPREAGARMLLQGDRITTVGTIGGGCVEAEALAQARRLLDKPDVRAELLHVSMTADEAEDEGMVCGGKVDILLERIP